MIIVSLLYIHIIVYTFEICNKCKNNEKRQDEKNIKNYIYYLVYISYLFIYIIIKIIKESVCYEFRKKCVYCKIYKK